jgi:hypothetical protein
MTEESNDKKENWEVGILFKSGNIYKEILNRGTISYLDSVNDKLGNWVSGISFEEGTELSGTQTGINVLAGFKEGSEAPTQSHSTVEEEFSLDITELQTPSISKIELIEKLEKEKEELKKKNWLLTKKLTELTEKFSSISEQYESGRKESIKAITALKKELTNLNEKFESIRERVSFKAVIPKSWIRFEENE